ncbi:MAG: aminopeptidase N [Thermodesulfobacteriota bacterium]
MTKPVAKYRHDYLPPSHLVDQVDLTISLADAGALVENSMLIRRNPAAATGQEDGIFLDGEGLELRELRLDGQLLTAGSDYECTAKGLTIARLPERCRLSCVTFIRPDDNKALEGLYRSNGNYCTQCEAEGFRKITYYPDRPDVMAVFTTTIEAPRSVPVLLANGNLVATGELPAGRHYARWHDPHPKPCYLFAMVAGDLVANSDTFVTRSGREVDLRVYVEGHNREKCQHAMVSLQKAMAWDEEVYGLEYDLDLYMVVAVDDFNMGAMENKGLNIFNSKYVLALAASATDSDYEGIEGVIAHEYFHNWTGNRVTCRDWFQLSLKEGLTVFRDQQFSAAMTNRSLKRIHDVQMLRTTQFIEDNGPMAHPIRPDSYIEINNFYTVTVYEKGAEVIRMIHTLLGEKTFRRGMDIYFERHDGQAVTCDDFVAAMAAAAGRDLSQFARWYSQAGTPELRVTGHYDGAKKEYRLLIHQSCPATPGQASKEPFHIPLRLGLVGRESGQDLPLMLASGQPCDGLLELKKETEELVFSGVTEPVVPSLLRDFSAPVKLSCDYTPDELRFLLAHDSDPFNRWEAGQRLCSQLLLALIADYQAKRPLSLDHGLIKLFAQLLDDLADPGLLAALLELPSEKYLAEEMAVVDVEAIFTCRRFMMSELARELFSSFIGVYEAMAPNAPHAYQAEQVSRRQLRNLCLSYLMVEPADGVVDLALAQFSQADNMSDCLAALRAIVHGQESTKREGVLADFYHRWQDDPLVLDKWFVVQATAPHPRHTLDRVVSLLDHPDFTMKNPNKVRSLIGSFAGANQICFHGDTGAGYLFLADRVLELNDFNPQIGARLLAPLLRWRRFDPERQALMQAQLQRILAKDNLAGDIYEIASKGLAES